MCIYICIYRECPGEDLTLSGFLRAMPVLNNGGSGVVVMLNQVRTRVYTAAAY